MCREDAAIISFDWTISINKIIIVVVTLIVGGIIIRPHNLIIINEFIVFKLIEIVIVIFQIYLRVLIIVNDGKLHYHYDFYFSNNYINILILCWL